MSKDKEPIDRSDIVPGFYKSNVWPFYFQIIHNQKYGHILWGFSIYKKEPGYRTFGSSIERWFAEYPDSKIYKDKDRTVLKNITSKFLKKYKEKHDL